MESFRSEDGRFYFDIELSISLVETRPVLWDKRDNVYKDRIEKIKARTDLCT